MKKEVDEDEDEDGVKKKMRRLGLGKMRRLTPTRQKKQLICEFV